MESFMAQDCPKKIGAAAERAGGGSLSFGVTDHFVNRVKFSEPLSRNAHGKYSQDEYC